MICGKCGKAVKERVNGSWHEFYGCDCLPRSYSVDPYDTRKTVRVDAVQSDSEPNGGA